MLKHVPTSTTILSVAALLSLAAHGTLQAAGVGLPQAGPASRDLVKVQAVTTSTDADLAACRDKQDLSACANVSGDPARSASDRAYAFVVRGEKALGKDAQSLEAAVIFYSEALRLDPKNGEAYFARGEAHRALRALDKALHDFSEAARLSPKSTEPPAGKADILLSLKRYDEAIAELNKVIELDAADHRTLWRRAIARQAKGLLDDAHTDIRAALKLSASSADYLNTLGVLQQLKGDPRGALESFNAAIALDARHAGARLNRANALIATGAFESALTDVTAAERVLPSAAAEINIIRAEIHLAKGDLDKARTFAVAAVKADPARAHSRELDGRTLLAQGHSAGALAEFNEALRIDPRYAAAFIGRAGVHYMTGAKDKALADISEALRINPKSTLALAARARMNLERKDATAAIADLDALLAAVPNDPDATFLKTRALLLQHAEASLQKNDLRAALADFEALLRIDPSDWEVLALRANALVRKGDLAQALADASKAEGLSPQNPGTLLLKADLLSASRRFTDAGELYGKLLAVTPELAAAHAGVGVASAASADWSAAIASLDKAVDAGDKAPETLRLRAGALLASKQYDKALADLGAILAVQPLSAEAYSLRAIARLARSEWSLALEDLDKAVALAPDAHRYALRAWTYIRLGKPAEGLPDADRALELHKNFAMAYAARGLILDATGKREDATADLKRAVRAAPSFEEASSQLKAILGTAPDASTPPPDAEPRLSEERQNQVNRRRLDDEARAKQLRAASPAR